MAKVVKKYPTESLDSMLRRFKKKLDKDNTIKDLKKHEFYLSKSEKRKLKHKMALQRKERDEALALKREEMLKKRFASVNGREERY